MHQLVQECRDAARWVVVCSIACTCMHPCLSALVHAAAVACTLSACTYTLHACSHTQHMRGCTAHCGRCAVCVCAHTRCLFARTALQEHAHFCMHTVSTHTRHARICTVCSRCQCAHRTLCCVCTRKRTVCARRCSCAQPGRHLHAPWTLCCVFAVCLLGSTHTICAAQEQLHHCWLCYCCW